VIVDGIQDSEETVSISDTAEDSISDSEEITAIPTEDMEDRQDTPDSTTMEVAPGPCTDWSTEDTDIGEPPTYMLAGIEVDDNDGWQVTGEHILSSSRPDIQPRPQSTVATVVTTTATALGLTLVKCTTTPRSRTSPHSARRIGRGRVEWASQDPSICLLGPVCIPSATWFQRDLSRLFGLIHRPPVVRIQRAAIKLRRLPLPRTVVARCPPRQFDLMGILIVVCCLATLRVAECHLRVQMEL